MIKSVAALSIVVLSQIASAQPAIEINTTCVFRAGNQSGAATLVAQEGQAVHVPQDPRRNAVNLRVFFRSTPYVRQVQVLNLTHNNRRFDDSFMYLSEWVSTTSLTERGTTYVQEALGNLYSDTEMVRLATYRKTALTGFLSVELVYGEARLNNGDVQGFIIAPDGFRGLCAR